MPFYVIKYTTYSVKNGAIFGWVQVVMYHYIIVVHCLWLTTYQNGQQWTLSRENSEENQLTAELNRLMLYTRLASPVAMCIDIPRRYTQLAWLANPNPNPTNPNPTNPNPTLALTLNPTNPSYG